MTVLPLDPPEDMCAVDLPDVFKTTVLPPTPPSSHSSRTSSPSPIAETAPTGDQTGAAKKKKKKKAKKAAKEKEASPKQKEGEGAEERPPILCISRNKHWRYISSYHVRLMILSLKFDLMFVVCVGTLAPAPR